MAKKYIFDGRGIKRAQTAIRVRQLRNSVKTLTRNLAKRKKDLARFEKKLIRLGGKL